MVAALLNNIPTAWAVPLAGYIGYLTYQLSSFCETDPPAVPSFSAVDVANLLNPYNPVLFTEAQEKFQQLIGAFLWYQVCRCDAVATPAPPPAPPTPTGMPSVNPPSVAPSYPTDQPCATYTYSFHLIVGDGSTPAPIQVPLPPGGITTARLTAVPTRAMVAGESGWQVNLNTFNSNGVFISNPVHVEASGVGSSLTMTGALPTTTASWRVLMSNFGITAPVDIDLTLEFFCGAPGSGNVQQPCPTDPYTLEILDQILAMVRLIQRQAVPFSYVASTPHAGLSGEGEISVQGLIGCRILLTSIPSNVGIEDGDPLTYWQAGWIRWGNADGFAERSHISASPQVSFPSDAGQFTRIGYTLSPGVVATITELVREP